jgi:hypothetical protein
MSGRLIILPKKSYCPWNPKNLERVAQDEKEHREKQEQEEKQRCQEESHLRLTQLRKRIRDHDDADDKLQRFSLFAKEEQEQNDRLQGESLQGNPRAGQNSARGNKIQKDKRRNLGDFSSMSDDTPFYMKSRPNGEDAQPSEAILRKDRRVKDHLDPMKQFHQSRQGDDYARSLVSATQDSISKPDDNNAIAKDARRSGTGQGHLRPELRSGNTSDHDESSRSSASASHDRKKRRKNKHRKKDKKKSRKDKREKSRGTETAGSNSNVDSLEELRKRRAEREELERKRQDDLMGRSHGNLRYHDQYNPRLSRK